MPTSNYSWPYPASTDAPNVPTHIRNLADAADTTVKAVDTRLAAVEAAYSSGIIAYGERDTSSPGATSSADVGALRIDNIPIISGRMYVIRLGAHPDSTVLSDTFHGSVRGSTSGAATTSSTVLRNSQFYLPIGVAMSWQFVYKATVTGTLSLLLCASRFAGSGSCSYFADGPRNTEMWVEAMNPTIADTGIDV